MTQALTLALIAMLGSAQLWWPKIEAKEEQA